MFTFNNETIFTGYIKQLLADFNLPKYKVYTQEDAKYHIEAMKHNATHPDDLWPEESVHILETITDDNTADSNTINYIRYINYIRGNNIERYINGEWVPTKWHYHYNKNELNQTKNLVVKSNIYDSYTHEYLGDYLRFQRDYNNIDLMSMYNCFSNVICQNLYINHVGNNKKVFKFDTDDKNYKIYMVPVKLFKKYTIAIDSAAPVEMCCSFFSKYYLPEITYSSIDENSRVVSTLEQLTYQRFNSMQFNTPILYDKLFVSNNKKEGALLALSQDERIICTQHEADLKLFIKLPLDNNSSITILEGDYRHFNDSVLKLSGFNGVIANVSSNKSVTNFDKFDSDVLAVNKQKLTPISELELLAGNTAVSYPFADRLIEYLLGNVITPNDEITDNIKRVQKVINCTKKEYSKPLNGIWLNEYRHYLYNSIINNNEILFDNKYDILGYIDKETEKYYSAKDEFEQTLTIANVDIYPDIYKDNKK